MGWKLVKRAMNKETQIGIAVFQKPTDNQIYNMRKVDDPPICDADDKPEAAWWVAGLSSIYYVLCSLAFIVTSLQCQTVLIWCLHKPQ